MIREAHDAPVGAHFGMDKTLWRVEQAFYWPKMSADVREYVRSCDLCQRSKPAQGKTRDLLQPLPIPSDRWEEVSMDFVTGLPVTPKGHDAALVIVDRLSKWAYFIPTPGRQTMPRRPLRFSTTWCSKGMGCLGGLSSDRDPKFTSNFWGSLFTAMGTHLGMSTAYHPQTDGQTERCEQSVGRGTEELCDSFSG